MIFVFIPPHVELGRCDYPEGAPHFSCKLLNLTRIIAIQVAGKAVLNIIDQKSTDYFSENRTISSERIYIDAPLPSNSSAYFRNIDTARRAEHELISLINV